MPSIKLLPSGQVLNAPRKVNLLKFLQENQIPVGSACGGMGLCASCKVRLVKGIENLNDPNNREQDLMTRNNLQHNERISCQCKILGDIEITTSYW